MLQRASTGIGVACRTSRNRNDTTVGRFCLPTEKRGGGSGQKWRATFSARGIICRRGENISRRKDEEGDPRC